MGEWWYAVGMRRNGPTDEATLKRLLQDNSISAATLVWREGMEGWVPLGDAPALHALLKVLPPPLPEVLVEPATAQLQKDPPPVPAPATLPDVTLTQQSRAALVPAGPWRRWLARMFDLWLTMFVTGLLAMLVSLLWPTALSRLSRSPGAMTLLTLVLLLVALMLDAGVHALFGNTPGKAMLGLRVRSLDDSRPSFWNYLGRNLALWGSGLAFGVPLFSLLTMAYQYRRLRRGEPASYDGSNYCVLRQGVGLTRTVLFVLGFTLMLILNGVLSAVAGQVVRAAGEAQVQQAQVRSQAQAEGLPAHERLPAAEPSFPNCDFHFYRASAPRIDNPKLALRSSSLCYGGAWTVYSGLTRTPLWSAEHLTADSVAAAEKLDFNPSVHPEPALPEADRSTEADFVASGYAMVPLISPSRLATVEARVDSAALANVVALVDSGLPKLWMGLGNRIAKLARGGSDLYVVSGTLFEGGSLRQLNGRVLVPTALYIAYYDARADRSGAYLLDNQINGKIHAVDLGELQRRAGVTMFPALPTGTQAAAVAPLAPVEPQANAPTGAIRKAVVDFTTCEKPTYPASALRNEETGTSQIAFHVDARGKVLDSRIERSSGSRKLDEATRDAIKACNFTPAKKGGKPVDSWVTIDYVWTLE